MDIKFLKEENLLDAHKQFMRLCEWSYVPQNLEEDDDENDNPTDPSMDNAPQDGNAPQDNQGMDDNSLQNNDMSQSSNSPSNDQSTDDNMPNEPMDNNMPLNNDMAEPMDNPMGDGMQQDDSMMNPEMDDAQDDVIDVDDITNAQEKMNTKVNHVGRELGTVDGKIESLLQAINKMETMINNNNQEIANFKQEFERRNPTQTEKLNLRSLDSYPFNVSPKDYWEKKDNDIYSNYSAYSNNDEPTTNEYELTDADVNDYSDREIEKSFDIDDDLNQDIKKIFNL